MTLAQLLVFSAFAPIARLLARLGARQWLVLAGSVLAIYWLQPLTSIRYLDFWFPTAALALTVWTWAATRPAPAQSAVARTQAATRQSGDAAPPRLYSARNEASGGASAPANSGNASASPASPPTNERRNEAAGPASAPTNSGTEPASAPSASANLGNEAAGAPSGATNPGNEAAGAASAPTNSGNEAASAAAPRQGRDAAVPRLSSNRNEPASAPAAPTHERRANLVTGLVIAGLVVGVGLLRYLGPACCLTPAPPPSLPVIFAGLAVVAAITALLLRLPAAGRWLNLGVILLIALLFITKFEPAGQAAAAGLRGLAGQATDLASAADLRWLGFSYLSFRLIHVLRDRAAGRLPAVSLREFVSYAVFFPAYTAGPIDRVERFVKDDRQPFQLNSEVVLAGGSRIAMGVFKKFVLADGLALFALNANNATQATTPFWMWILLYAYAWRLYLDFSGYTDIALGLARFFGIKLPENFDRPYFRQNLTLFWNSWHISLSQWFRAYVFNPLTRALRARPLPPAAIILITQMVTMLLIGLWHGATLNFVIWGAWHGFGLFVHNRWADFMKPRAALLDARPRLKRAAHLAGVVITFHYVILGWVWFALPTPYLALAVFQRLFGLGATI